MRKLDAEEMKDIQKLVHLIMTGKVASKQIGNTIIVGSGKSVRNIKNFMSKLRYSPSRVL